MRKLCPLIKTGAVGILRAEAANEVEEDIEHNTDQRTSIMRKNLPVTDREYVLPDDAFIVSKTDEKGKITYFNEAFHEASGFEKWGVDG